MWSRQLPWRSGSVLRHRPTGHEFDPARGQVSPIHLLYPDGCSALTQQEKLCINLFITVCVIATTYCRFFWQMCQADTSEDEEDEEEEEEQRQQQQQHWYW